MPDSEPKTEDASGWQAIIGNYPTSREAHEAGLAILAAGKPYWVYPIEGRYVVVVAREHADDLRKELEIAERKNRFWPPPPLDMPTSSTRKTPTLVSNILLIAVFYFQNRFPHIESLGMNSSQAVMQDHHWWRSVTAITLHADIGHLIGNLATLSIFAFLCCLSMGNGIAWLSILLGAGLANFANAWMHSAESFNSLGASTAVFTALGLLAGLPLATLLKTRKAVSSRDWIVPFFGGCVIFAWMGGGPLPVDVGGHLLSFAIGTLLAFPAAMIAGSVRNRPFPQMLALALSALSVSGCWLLALL